MEEQLFGLLFISPILLAFIFILWPARGGNRRDRDANGALWTGADVDGDGGDGGGD